MVEILRPTAIGRLEELGVNQDSSGVSIGECGMNFCEIDKHILFIFTTFLSDVNCK